MTAHAFGMKNIVNLYRIKKSEKDEHGAVKRFVLVPIIIGEQDSFRADMFFPSLSETFTNTALVYEETIGFMRISNHGQEIMEAEFVKWNNDYYQVISVNQRCQVGKVWGYELSIKRWQGETPRTEEP